MDHLTFDVVGTPAPQGSKTHLGDGRMRESSKNVGPWRAAVAWAARSAASAAGVDGLAFDPDAALRVHVEFTMTRPKSHYGRGGAVKTSAPAWVTRTPDLDKLLRSTFDAITDAGIWRDDSRVAAVTATKIYDQVAGARIRITRIGEDEGGS